MRMDLPVFAPAAARSLRCTEARRGLPHLRWWHAAGGGAASSPGTSGGLEEKRRTRRWHSDAEGVSRGLFIGSDGPLTARIKCARPVRAPGYGAHVRVVRGITVAFGNGHTVGHGYHGAARDPRGNRGADMPLGTAIHNIEITLGKGGQLADRKSVV